MKQQNKRKYDELQAEIFLLSEENEQLKTKLHAAKKEQQEQLDFICQLDDLDDCEKKAINFLTRKLEEAVKCQ